MSKIKSFLRGRLSAVQTERAKIIYEGFSDLYQTFRHRPIYPISIEELRLTLEGMQVSRGDVVLVHSSVSHLFKGSLVRLNPPIENMLTYASSIVAMLLDLLGPEGTLLMNTDSIKNIFLFTSQNQVFDYRRSPSRRGLISEIFRRRNDVLRSVHPWYNIAGCGKWAKELISDHEKSTPYAMDKHSPWFKLQEMNAKVLLLGSGFEANSPIHVVEYVHPEEFPRPIYLNRPLEVRYVGNDQEVHEMPLMIHAPLWKPGQETRFAYYLQEKYGFYKIKALRDTEIISYPAKAQYEAILNEARNNITWYDPVFW